MFPKLLVPLLALHWMMILPGRSCDFWKELHSNSCSLYHSMKVVGESLENHMRTINLLLEKFSNTAGCWMDEHLRDMENWMEENMGALTKLVSDQVHNLSEWLEKHAQDLSTRLIVNFGNLHQCQDTHTKDYSYELGAEILAYDEFSDKTINQTDMWLDQYLHIAPVEQLSEHLLNFYEVSEMCASKVSSSPEDCAHVHVQFLKDHVEMLQQLWNTCRATLSVLLKEHNATEETDFQKYTWDFLNVDPHVDGPGSAEATAQQLKWLSFMEWLEKRTDDLEQWLQSITEE